MCAEIAIYDGTAVVTGYKIEMSTEAVNVNLIDGSKAIREISYEIAAQRNWRPDWLNEGVKGFISVRDKLAQIYLKSYPSEVNPALKVFVPTKEYLLAMKCMAIRPGSTEHDVDDIKRLVSDLRYTTADQVLDLVAGFYPKISCAEGASE